jgi:hypothetical protein
VGKEQVAPGLAHHPVAIRKGPGAVTMFIKRAPLPGNLVDQQADWS